MVVIMVKLLCGVGLNDLKSIARASSGSVKQKDCFYEAWSHMIKRCYSTKSISQRASYEGCTVCEDWLKFSNFKSWMQKQDWRGKSLDKDIILNSNKVYSPDTCAFVSKLTNSFVTKPNRYSELPIGCHFDSREGKYKAQCGNPFTKKQESLGYFNNPEDAHKAWKKRKHELSCQLAELQSDQRVAEALMVRYQ